MTEPGIADVMETYALDGVDVARANLGIEFDYSVESTRALDDILHGSTTTCRRTRSCLRRRVPTSA